jgi:hypothetical protein
MAASANRDNKFLNEFLNPEMSEARGHTVTQPHIFNPNNYKNIRFKLVKKVVFQKDVSFKGTSLNSGIRFVDCEFKKSLLFDKCSASDFDQDIPFEKYNIQFENCEINQLTFMYSDIEQGVRISRNSTIRSLNIEVLNISKGSLLFDGVTIEEYFQVKNIKIEEAHGSLDIKNTTAKIHTQMSNINVSNFNIRKCSFISDFSFNSSVVNIINVRTTKFLDDVHISRNRINESLIIDNCEFDKSIHISNSGGNAKLNELYISGTNFVNSLYFEGNNNITQKVAIHFSEKGAIQFASCLINDLELKGQNLNSFAVFYYCQFGHLYFNHLLNFGNISFISCRANPEFKDSSVDLYNSTIGKTQFNNFDFNSFQKTVINDSHVQDILTNGVNWFEDTKLEVGTTDDKSLYRKKREIYRQLKYASDKQGDRIQYLEFKARELKAFRNYVKTNNRSKFDNDRIVLRAAETNDYGLNWKKAFWQFLLITLGFYPLIVISASTALTWLPASSIEDVILTLKELWENAKILPQLINPARVLQRMFPENSDFGLGLYVWDGLHRLLLAFYIFQIVSAFRKYVK